MLFRVISFGLALVPLNDTAADYKLLQGRRNCSCTYFPQAHHWQYQAPSTMDLYGSWDPSLASSSGSNTPVRETADDANVPGGSNSNDGNASGSSNTPGSTSTAAPATKARSPTIEQEIEQMGTLVSGMGKNLGSYWSSFRRQVSMIIQQECLWDCATCGRVLQSASPLGPRRSSLSTVGPFKEADCLAPML